MQALLRLVLVVVGMALVAVSPARAEMSRMAPEYSSVAATVAEILDSPERLPLPIERIRPALKAHYITNNGPIYWIGSGRMTPFIQRLANAEVDGLNPADYPVESLKQVRDQVAGDNAFDAAQAELLFSAFYVAYAADLKIGRVAPSKVDPSLFRNRKTIDVLRVLTDMSKQRDPGKFLSAYESKNPHYQALKRMLGLYRAMAKSGAWPVVGQGSNIAPGGSDPRLPQIRTVLSMTGDYKGAPSGSSSYDPATVAAMQSFQRRNGLEAKGLIGKQTIMVLNIPPSERVKQIVLNMERWRWMPENLGAYHFLVNLAGFELQQVRNAQVIDRMNVVVGAVATQTPEFSDELEYVEINPTWTVPYNIATKEMLPKLRSNPFAYATDFDVFMNGKLISWGGIDWASYGPGKFPFTFRQHPGPKNALGKVKFMLPNRHNIYLHDTPAKDKFLQTTRAFSHGCIRLSRPLDLLNQVVGGVVGWPQSKIDAVLASGKTTQVPLPIKIPVHLIYATAFMGPDGVEFRPDVYGRDRKLYAALFGKPSS